MPRLPRNTCPNIDEVIDFLKEVSENENFERGARWMIDIMEELRYANSTLRGVAEEGIEAQDRVEELEYEVEELKSEVEELKSEVEELRARISILEYKMDKMEGQD
jgi:peptidoglycan hydrolase CwlO-like protein